MFCLCAVASAQDKAHLKLDSPYGSFVEDDFPFFSQTVDARDFGKGWPKDNLTPRGIVLKLGHGYYACFDTDLLRIALIWKENKDGEYLEMGGMAPGSYRLPNRKASAGQENLPKPIGTPLLANGIYPGWFVGESEPKLEDPREESVDPEEIGLGPLPVEMGRWNGLNLLRARLPGDDRIRHDWVVMMQYLVGETSVAERILHLEPGKIVRYFLVKAHDEPIHGLLNQLETSGEPSFFTIPPAEEMECWKVELATGRLEKVTEKPYWPFLLMSGKPAWQKTVTTSVVKPSKPADPEAAFAFEEVGLPLKNPWKRNVRLSGFDFFSDGRAAFCTFDGDVWIVDGLTGDLKEVDWRRYASGLHEPIALEIVDDHVFVFDRNGIQLLQGEEGRPASWYANFCNLVPQTAETREFANDLYEKPGGGFYLCKGGQVSSTRGLANGTVVEVAADGKSYEIIATGFRMPYIGVDPVTGLVTASDQQGHWKPATPIRVVEKGEYYGFQPAKFKDKAVHPQPIAEPEIWIPHFVNQSGASQVWLRDAKMGPLNDSLIHIGYNRPELFKVYFDESGKTRQGAVAPVMAGFPSGLLKGRVHPKDGSLWLTGFKIWGTSAEQISGLYRVRPNGNPSWIPRQVRSGKRGVLLRFDQPVTADIATDLASYTVDRWNYQRTHNYGSGHFKLDGEPGQETLPVASATLSKDKTAIFLGIPDMKPAHSLRVTYRQPVASENPLPVIQNVYLTIHELNEIALEKEGFAAGAEIDLTLKAGAGQEMKAPNPSIEIGKQAYVNYGCVACHTVDGSKVPPALKALADAGQQVVVGPGWKGLWGSKKEFTDGTILKSVDEVYLRESIVDPGRKVSKGFETEKTGVGMASYLGVLKDYEIDSLILYIKALRKK